MRGQTEVMEVRSQSKHRQGERPGREARGCIWVPALVPSSPGPQYQWPGQGDLWVEQKAPKESSLRGGGGERGVL